ncbi:ROK family protein [Bacteroidales bacterium OttesenSCG-928-A17]|nr:ROK family protein [Bacteroidales bacterium OttesenSCG-928-A17]
MNNTKTYAVGADIGGGHITTAVIDLTNAKIIESSLVRKHVNAQGNAEEILSAWTESIMESVAKAIDSEKTEKSSIKGVGLAMPGPFDYPNGISLINDPSQNKFLSLYQMSIRNELAQRTGFEAENIRFKNDAECFLLGEVFGKQDISRAIGVTLGTGFGSAFVFDGVSEDGNLWCAPFKGGIAEDAISTRFFVNRYKELTGKDAKGVKELADIISHDEKAKQVFDEFGKTLKEFLVPLVVKHNADTLIIGGNIALAWNLFIEALEKELKEISPATRLKPAALGEKAALMGGASLLQ